MCEVWRPPAAGPRPRWSWLYAIFPLAVVACALTEAAAPARMVQPLLCGVGAGIWAGIAGWIRANRTALEQADWCACASEKITIRVIASQPRQRHRHVDPIIRDEPRLPAERAGAPLVTLSR